jgi:hypothetical protein
MGDGEGEGSGGVLQTSLQFCIRISRAKLLVSFAPTSFPVLTASARYSTVDARYLDIHSIVRDRPSQVAPAC